LPSPTTSRAWILAPVLCVLLLPGCNANRGGEPAQGRRHDPGSANQPASPAARSGERHDLSVDEEHGGHTLQRHIGKSDAELAARLNDERNISAASTYTDRATAELAVGEAIAAGHERIEQWLARPGRHPNLVLDYHSPQPIGRSLRRGERSSDPCSEALVVLKWAPENRYYVLTSYPDCR